MAVLNSCEGARASLNDPFSSVATSLIEHEVPAVIGMQFEITDRAAILFSGEFYAALADGRAVDEALSQARMAIFADNNDIEWGTPVLFMRVTDGRLFDVETPPRRRRRPSQAEAERRLARDAPGAERAAAAVATGVQPGKPDTAAEAVAPSAQEQRRRRPRPSACARSRPRQRGEAERQRQEDAAAAEADRARAGSRRQPPSAERLRQEQAAAEGGARGASKQAEAANSRGRSA